MSITASTEAAGLGGDLEAAHPEGDMTDDEADKYYDQWLVARKKVERLTAQVALLRAALGPFAALTSSEDYIKSGPPEGLCAAMSYRVQDYRNAREAMEKTHA